MMVIRALATTVALCCCRWLKKFQGQTYDSLITMVFANTWPPTRSLLKYPQTIHPRRAFGPYSRPRARVADPQRRQNTRRTTTTWAEGQRLPGGQYAGHYTSSYEHSTGARRTAYNTGSYGITLFRRYAAYRGVAEGLYAFGGAYKGGGAYRHG